MESYDVIIVGAGHAGAQTAIALRQHGFEGSVALVGDEPDLPYERPPLSKEYLSGDKEFARMALRPEAFWQEKAITLFLGKRVSQVSSGLQEITLSDDTVLRYGKLVWAAGGAPRMLDCPGSHSRNVFGVRRKSDSDAIRTALPDATNVVIIGGGFIGLEVAAVAAKAGKKVTIIEVQDRLLSRVSGQIIADYYHKLHVSHGVHIRLHTKAEKFVTNDEGKATSILLDDGSALPCDLVVFGIGIIPETGPLVADGAMGGNGVDVDGLCRTSLSDIYAIGDCANHANAYAHGAHIRLESVQNANDQAKTVAQDIIGKGKPYRVVPWFWSNQYDARLQTVGMTLGHDEEILRGDPESGSFSVIYLRDDKVVALDCVNKTKDYVQGRALVEAAVEDGQELDKAQLADTEIPLKEVGRA
ncbi:NAD(P)/FAD-dependent oxidoreductase [Alterisphingorhabdus coralli]|uniref:FAD-dependent oxidoreductase n=1 Tax=Alterisphingorhabdus coralli TaxID=3071408 RepID=A0AA97F9U0_9SPHN|nr:FAD-dependent oxidoreductase [Parasphingorhabdus sp. SCSIO 66989]WOE76576.1 FAD-dependent oxidoreductase [Parasphingorhabdus sp. SCSIO 66989]